MVPFVKLPLLLATALFYDRSCVPPAFPPSVEEQKRADSNGHRTVGWYERLAVPIVPLWTRMSFWALTITEAIYILAPVEATHSLIATGDSGDYDIRGRITLISFIGACLIITGAIIRFRCFRELGRHFTFALSLRDDHALITSGPYAVVRHPAYTAGNMTICGAAMTLMCDGSWWFGVGYATRWGLFLGVNFVVSALLVVRAFLRGVQEDPYLRASFGEQWERYAKQVPYRYIPGVC
ncbi:hypothetical protein C8R43DRAFT_1086962 [Mycena crocata]|nr:hypothetical protein C8R43DRAFT_1086962 [Mycena crocata]